MIQGAETLGSPNPCPKLIFVGSVKATDLGSERGLIQGAETKGSSNPWPEYKLVDFIDIEINRSGV